MSEWWERVDYDPKYHIKVYETYLTCFEESMVRDFLGQHADVLAGASALKLLQLFLTWAKMKGWTDGFDGKLRRDR